MTTPSNTDSLPPGTRLGRTALRVTDLAEQVEFYRTVVGLSVLDEFAARAVLGVADSPLLILEGAPDAPTRGSSSTGLYHTAFRVPSRAALGDALARIRSRWQLDGASDHWVSESLYLTDPEGNGIEIYRDFPRDAWPRSDDGSVRISTDSLAIDSIEAAATGDTQAPPGTDIGHIHLEVSSLDAFRDFYVDALGFEIQTTVPAATFAAAGGYHHHIGANTWHTRTASINGRGLSWFEVVVPDQDTLTAIKSRLDTREIPVIETVDGLTIHDPDGIEVRMRIDPSTP